MTPSTVVYVRERTGLPFVIRALWFFLVGWHVTLYWIVAAWVFNVTIIGLPVGLWMLNQVPLVLTLRMPSTYIMAHMREGQVVGWQSQGKPQRPALIRALYFLVIGWWFSLLWSLVAWLLCISIIGLPFGVWMLNRLPEVTTLRRQ